MERVDYESVVIQDLLNFHAREELNVSPWYQRRAVWSGPQRAYLINTMFEGKPIPSIYVRHTIDLDREISVKEVVDGQQRVRCLIGYRNDEFAARHPDHQKRVLYSELTKPQRSRFLLTSMSVGYLVGADDTDVIEIFARINSVAKTLNPQEKRNALFSGEFKQFCLNEAVSRLAFWRSHSIFSDNNISRMEEVQFVSDLVTNLLDGLKDFSATKLTAYYKKFDDSFPDAESLRKRLEKAFSVLLDLDSDLLRGSAFSRPQVLFSLILVIDSMPGVRRKNLEACISAIDDRITAVRSGDQPKAMAADEYEAFAGGNQHRIRSRKKRDQVIRAYLT